MLPLDYHTRQVAIAGYSGSGKTTLITKLIRYYNELNYKVGVVKHDSHRLELDHKGKDSYRYHEAGAAALLAFDAHTQFFRHSASALAPYAHFQNCDFVLIEGHKQATFPKLCLLKDDEQLWHDLDSEAKKSVFGLIGSNSKPNFKTQLPYFHRDDSTGIAHFLLERWQADFKQQPLFGLLLSGGQSKRMGQDKNQMNYHGMPQYQWAHQLLSQVCKETYLSCRSDQSFEFNCVHDIHVDMGPLGGILSAMERFPGTAFLCIACDQPNLTEATLGRLVQERDPFSHATLYHSSGHHSPEPLCCIYEPDFRTIAYQALGHGIRSPKKILEQARTKIISSLSNELINVNSPSEANSFPFHST